MGIEETAGFENAIKAIKGDDGEIRRGLPAGRAKHGNDRKGDKSNVRYATIGFVAKIWDEQPPPARI